MANPIPLQVGIKTGCPWSAVNFVLAINQWLNWLCNCAPLNIISPNPVQGYADDVVIASRQEGVINTMLTRTDSFLEWSGLEVKDSKCAVFYERRSGGNRWYQSKSDSIPVFTINNKPLRVYARHETYTYLGHKFNVAGEWKDQVDDITSEYSTRLDLIDASPLPLIMKLEAIRQIALAKVQHLFSNVHIPRKALREMNDKTVRLVRQWTGLNSHSTRDIIFHSKQEGGLGVPNFEWTYFATRLGHLLNMLNSDDQYVRELARGSLFIDLKRRKVPLARGSDPNFLGFKTKPSGKLDSRSPGFGVWSDWPDLNDLCGWCEVALEWAGSNSEAVNVSEEVISDPSISVKATINICGVVHQLPLTNARGHLMRALQQRQQQHWTGLKLQGKLACLPAADHSVSHAVFKSVALDESIVIFTVKARLQVLPTKLNLSIWLPDSHAPHCIHHGQEQITETMAHILNGCHAYKGLYIYRHDRLVDLISKDISSIFGSLISLFKHFIVKPSMFNLCNDDSDVFLNIPANTPDVVVVNEHRREVFVLEVGCTFDHSLEEAFLTKIMKYQQLVQTISQLGYRCQLLVFIFGSLGHVHKLVVRGLQMAGLPKRRAKQLARYCSISTIIGSRSIWRRRCFLYP